MQEQKRNQNGWAFLSWPDSSNWEEVKHMEWGNSVSWVISSALFRYQYVLLNSLSKSAGSSELRHKLPARPHACMSPSAFCCCHLKRRRSWILTESREDWHGRWVPMKGMEKVLSSSEKNPCFLLLFELHWKEGKDCPELQQKVGLMKIGAVGVKQGGMFSWLQGCICFQSLWQGCSLWRSINLNQIKLMCRHIYPSHWLSYIMF